MTDQQEDKTDYLEGLADRVSDTTDITYVAARLRRFIESHDFTQLELIEMLGTTRTGFVKLALCIEPAEPTENDFAALHQISEWTGISVGSIMGLWADEVDDNDVEN